MSLIKRSACIVFFFDNDGLRCTNYLTGITVASTPILVAVLNFFDRWRKSAQVNRLIRGYSASSIRNTLSQLLEHTLLIKKGSVQSKREDGLTVWSDWELEARFFHFATKHAFRLGAPLPDEKMLNRTLYRKGPQPKLIKCYPLAARVDLPDPRAPLNSEFPRVLLQRRTFRDFGHGQLSLHQLSALLWLTWGVTGRLCWPGLGKLLLKTSPSGGARHPIEAYCWALRIAGLPRGIYHYRGDRNCLERLQKGVRADRLVELCARQEWVCESAAVLVMTGVLSRVTWRYRFSRAYRTILLEAGHFCQTFCLVATWLGLAPFCTAALVDQEIEMDLGIDGSGESVLYAAGVGLKNLTAPDGITNRKWPGAREIASHVAWPPAKSVGKMLNRPGR
jgi:SagB-type dehydrogenase family enzyme